MALEDSRYREAMKLILSELGSIPDSTPYFFTLSQGRQMNARICRPYRAQDVFFTFTPDYARGYTSCWPFRPPEDVRAHVG